MADIFISYSCKDIAFAHLLYDALKQSQLDVWIDWERIPAGEDWWKEIEAAVEASQIFMFIISRNSIGSAVCKKEINHALSNNKRIIPVIVDDLPASEVNQFVPDLARINWMIFQRDHVYQFISTPENEDGTALPRQPQFEQAILKLSQTITQDWDWVREHTRLQVRALDWERHSREVSYLLRGKELEEAEAWLVRAAKQDPQPTTLQAQYLSAGRSEETRRQGEAIRRQRITSIAILGGLIVAVLLGLVAWSQRNQYLDETHVRATAESNAISQANSRATAEANAVSEANSRATAEANAVSESHARATQEAVAIEQRNVAVNRQLAAQARNLAASTLDAGLLLAVEAGRASGQADVQSTVLDLLQAGPALLAYIPGHPHGFNQVAISPDGRLLAAGSVDYTLQLYDLASGKPSGVPLRGAPSEVTAVAFSPDGRTLAAVCNDPLVFFWDIRDPAHPKALPTLQMKMDSAEMTTAINSDGKIFMTWTGRFQLGLNGLWNKYEDTPSEDMRLHNYGAFSLQYSPDGSLLAVGGGDGKLRLLDTQSGQWNADLSMLSNNPAQVIQDDYVMNLSFSNDGRRLVASAGANVYAWDLAEKKLLAERNCSLANSQLYIPSAIDPTGERMVFVCNTNNTSETGSPILRIIDIKDNQDEPEQVLPEQMLSLTFSPGGASDLLALGASENSIIIWNMATGQAVGEPLRAHNSEVVSLAFTTDGSRLVSADWNHNLAVWAMSPDEELSRIERRVTFEKENEFLSDQIGNLTFGPDGRQLFAVYYVGSKLYEAGLDSGAAPRMVGDFSTDFKYITGLAFLPKANAVAIIQSSGAVTLVDPASFKVLRSFSILPTPAASPTPGAGDAGSSDQAYSTASTEDAAFDPSGLRLAMAGKGVVGLWDVQTGQALPQKLSVPDFTFSQPTFSPDGSLLAVRGKGGAGSQDVLFLWRPANGEVTRLPLTTGADNGGVLVSFSPDNRSLAYSRLDKNYYLCDLTVSTPLCRLGGSNTNWITGLAYNHSGTLLASLSSDGSFRLWDNNAKSAGSLPIPAGYYTFTWSADDRQIAVGGFSHTIRLLDASLAPWIETACRVAGRNLGLVEWQTYFPGQPYRKTCPSQPLHPSVVERFLVDQAANIAQGGIDAALQTYAKELPLDTALLPELKSAASAFPPQALARRAVYLADQDAPAAVAAAGELKALFGAQGMDPDAWNAVCWFGSLYGQPAAALPFCQLALDLQPGNPSYLDSRGLARALTGDLAGAAADFKVFAAAARQAGQYEPYGKERDAWISALEMGQNPFDAATIEALKKE